MPDDPLDLPAVVREITAALLKGDWARFAVESDGRFYYVVRESDRLSLSAVGRDWDSVVHSKAENPSDFEDWYMRAVLAEAPSDHFAKAHKRFASAGFDSNFFDAVVSAVRSADSQKQLQRVMEEWLPRIATGHESDVEHVLALLEAIRIDRIKSGHLNLSDSDRLALLSAWNRVLREFGFVKANRDELPSGYGPPDVRVDAAHSPRWADQLDAEDRSGRVRA